MLLIIAFSMFALLVVGWLVIPEKTAEVETTPTVVPTPAPTAVPAAI